MELIYGLYNIKELDLYPALVDDFCQELVTVICIAAISAQMLS